MRLQLTLTNRYLSKERQMISRGWSEWAHATRTSAIAEVQQQLAAERSTVKTFALLAKCAHDPLRALRRLNQLDAWRALQEQNRNCFFFQLARSTQALRELGPGLRRLRSGSLGGCGAQRSLPRGGAGRPTLRLSSSRSRRRLSRRCRRRRHANVHFVC